MTLGTVRRSVVAAVAGLVAGVVTVAAIAAQGAVPPAERVAALKQSMAQSQKQLRQYEWIETTIISLKGEEKARVQKRCYYGADGKLQKVAIEPAKPKDEPSGRGGRGGRAAQRIIENKKDDMKEYMEQAGALIHKYVPPDPEDIQKAKDRAKVEQLAPGQVRVTFSDYLQPGDHLVIDADAATNHLKGLSVATYLDKKEDTVALTVKLGALTDGTTYTAETTLDAKAKNIRVVTQNYGYKPVGK